MSYNQYLPVCSLSSLGLCLLQSLQSLPAHRPASYSDCERTPNVYRVSLAYH
jgi:hypothetical protein